MGSKELRGTTLY